MFFILLIHKIFYFIINNIPFGSKFLLLFLKSDFYYYISDIIYNYIGYHSAEKKRINPTKQMFDSRIFYSLNKERTKCVSSLFIDDESKETYLKMINFRCYSEVERYPSADRRTSYFWNDYFSFGQNEVLIDCGAYIGDTIISFKKVIKHFKGKINKIIAFEPEKNNYKILCREFKNIIAINARVWDKDTILTLSGNDIGTTSSFIKETSEINKNKEKGGG